MLDINLFREEKGGNPELVRESQRRRYADVSLVDKVLENDLKWREARTRLDAVRKELNATSREVGQLRKAGKDATELQERSKVLKAQIAELEAEEKAFVETRDASVQLIGNIIDDSVPVDDDEANNEVVRLVGTPRDEPKLFNHVDLVKMLGIAEMDAGSDVAGSRGYYLMREGVLLNQAIINFALATGVAKGFEPVQTPYFMNKSVMAACAQLSQFDEELYKVSGDGDDKYLIATAEQPLCALHRDRWFERSELPRRYVGYSTCFRKEAGSHGRDTLGIFRVHQFEKVEQFVVASNEPGASEAELARMLANAEEFYTSLGFSYRVVNIVSGELNNAASKKYDLEAWFPASKTYRELVSCSNCTDYQSRNLNARLRSAGGPDSDSKKEYVHMLNSTLSATTRTLCCLLETYQTPDGVVIPEALRPYAFGLEFVPFRYKLDKKGRTVKI